MKKNLNILQLISTLETISGPVKTLLLLSEGLVKKGHRVVVGYYAQGNESVIQELERRGIEVVNFGIGYWKLSIFQRLQLLFKLRRVITKYKINVVHAHCFDADMYAVISSLSKKINRVVTMHSRSHIHWAKRNNLSYKRLIFPRVSKLVCVCHNLVHELKLNFNFGKDRVVVIHNAPPSEFYAPDSKEKRAKVRQEFGVGDDEYLIGIVSNFSWVKGIDYFLEALTKLKNKPFKVLIVGGYFEGEMTKLKAFFDQNNLSSKIIMAGFQDNIPDVLDSLDLFILPSVEEADPWALSEAMARGKPVVASHVGGIPEKIIDGHTGILVSPRDSESLATAIQYCIDHQEEASLMGKNAQEHMQESFKFNSMIDQYEGLYETV